MEYPSFGEESMNALANFIQAEMARQGMNLTDLSIACGVPDSTLSRYVQGTVKRPNAIVLAHIARGLGVDWAVLMDLAGLTGGVAARKQGNVPADVLALLMTEPDLIDLVRRIGALPQGQQKAVVAFIRHLQDNHKSPGPHPK